MASWLGLTMRCGPEDGLDPPDLGLDLLGRAEGKDALGVDPAEEGDLPAEIPGQRLGVHVRGLGLERVEAVDAGGDELGDDPVDRAAGVEDDLVAAPVGLAGELLEPGQDEPVEERRADHQVELGAEVVAEEKGVDAVPGGVEEALVGLGNRSRRPGPWPLRRPRGGCAS